MYVGEEYDIVKSTYKSYRKCSIKIIRYTDTSRLHRPLAGYMNRTVFL